MNIRFLYTTLSEILSSELNTLQRMMLNFRTGSSQDLITTNSWRTTDSLVFQVGKAAAIAAGADHVIDSSIDWRNRTLLICHSTLSSASDVVGGAAEPYVNTYLQTAEQIMLFTGSGAKSANNPLDRAVNDYYSQSSGAIWQYYADSTSGALTIRNIDVTSRRVFGVVFDLIRVTA